MTRRKRIIEDVPKPAPEPIEALLPVPLPLGVPRIVWELLAVLLLILGGYLWYHHAVSAAYAKGKGDQYAVDKSALETTEANYRAATEKAKADDAANAQRVVTEQSAINERSDNDFQARIAAVRDLADRLRAQAAAAAAHSGSSSGAPMSGVPSTASLVAQIAEQDRLSLADRQTASEQAVQLDELIKWINAQAAVDVNNNPAPPKPAPPKKRNLLQRLNPF